MAGRCTRNSKIAFGVAGVLALVGLILIVVAYVSGSEGLKVGFESENSARVTLKTAAGSGDLGYSLHIKASDHGQCEAAAAATTITAPSGAGNPWLLTTCGEPQAEWEADNDPPLRKLGHFGLAEKDGAKVYGDYTIESTLPLWVVDSGEELGEAVGGIFAMLGLFAVAVVLLVASLIVCCVGCCCMGKSADDGGKPQMGTVVGQPAA